VSLSLPSETFFPDYIQNSIYGLQYFMIPKSQDRKTLPYQEILSNLVFIFFQGMLPPIYFNYDPSFKAHKINNITIDRLLPAEF